jgi:hypothetical protein
LPEGLAFFELVQAAVLGEVLSEALQFLEPELTLAVKRPGGLERRKGTARLPEPEPQSVLLRVEVSAAPHPCLSGGVAHDRIDAKRRLALLICGGGGLAGLPVHRLLLFTRVTLT